MKANTTIAIEAVDNGFIVRPFIERGILVDETLVFETKAKLFSYLSTRFDDPKDAKVEYE